MTRKVCKEELIWTILYNIHNCQGDIIITQQQTGLSWNTFELCFRFSTNFSTKKLFSPKIYCFTIPRTVTIPSVDRVVTIPNPRKVTTSRIATVPCTVTIPKTVSVQGQSEIEIELWQNSNPFFGSAALCSIEIGQFR